MNALVVLITIFIIPIICLVIYAHQFYQTTDITITINSKFIDPGHDSSHYLLQGKDQRIIELDRQFFNWSDNIDKLYFNAQVNQTKTYQCFGFENQAWHWYYLCYKEIKS